MPKYKPPTKSELDELCQVIYETELSPPWKRMKHIDTIRTATEAEAMRVWAWYQERKSIEEYL